MRNTRRLLTFALLTLWWVATMHCRLEAVTEIAACAAECHQHDAHHVPDGCEVVEAGEYKTSSHSVRVSPPDVAEFPRPISLVPPMHDSDKGSVLAARPERPCDWVTTWQFEHRAALLPGAPALA